LTTKTLKRLAIIVLLFAVKSGGASGQTLTNIYSFGSQSTDGGYPNGLVQGRDGNFYGTTQYGGTHDYGAVFRISPGGSYTNLHSFVGYGDPNDGANPNAGLIQGSDGNFYGAVNGGGIGAVFRINPSGDYTNLYLFSGYPDDGANPNARLVQGSDGNFYGTTEYGGTHDYGAVFRISPGGSYSNMYSFAGYPYDGSYPEGGLVQGGDGNFYGTTFNGGTSTNCTAGCGTVFRISPSGIYTTLYSFSNSSNDGGYPNAGLVQGSDGNFYGLTNTGGTNGNGVVFLISPSGSLTNLYSFMGFSGEFGPGSVLVQGSDGNFYGMTGQGGTSTNCFSGCGTVFRISPSGDYTDLYSFSGYPKDGGYPYGGLVRGSDGNFYGTTLNGGTNNEGTVFKLTVPLTAPPYPINQITGVQLCGSDIVFNIPSIAGETYQLQFSSSMNPTNWVNVPNVSVTNSIGALLTLTNFGGALSPQGFYRFTITP
jgi:uncharacterized repeat protein (TIGR03803 family)